MTDGHFVMDLPVVPEHRDHRFPVDGCWRCELKAELRLAIMEIHLEMEAQGAPPKQ